MTRQAEQIEVRTAPGGHLYHALVTFPDGECRTTEPASRARSWVVAHECLADTSLWEEDAEDAGRLLSDLKSTVSLLSPHLDQFANEDPQMHVLVMLGAVDGALDVGATGIQPKSGDAMRTASRALYGELQTGVRILNRATAEIHRLTADRHATALREHPIWQAILDEYHRLAIFVAATSMQLSAGVGRWDKPHCDPSTGTVSMPMSFVVVTDEDWPDQMADRFTTDPIMQEWYARGFPAEMRAIDVISAAAARP